MADLKAAEDLYIDETGKQRDRNNDQIIEQFRPKIDELVSGLKDTDILALEGYKGISGRRFTPQDEIRLQPLLKQMDEVVKGLPSSQQFGNELRFYNWKGLLGDEILRTYRKRQGSELPTRYLQYAQADTGVVSDAMPLPQEMETPKEIQVQKPWSYSEMAGDWQPPQPRSIADKLFGIGGERYQTWPERAARELYHSLVDPLPTPGDPGYMEDLTQRGNTIAGMAGGANIPRVAMGAEGLGVFGGINARRASMDQLEQALKMAGEHPDLPPRTAPTHLPEQIWEQTGWYREPKTGDWKFEIPDVGARLLQSGETMSKAALEKTIPKDLKGIELQKAVAEIGKQEKVMTLGELLDHPVLYNNYPELKNTKITFKTLPGALGQVTGKGEIELSNALNSRETLSVLLHEIQHKIQKTEGFSQGGSSASGMIEFDLKTPKHLNDKFMAANGTIYDLSKKYEGQFPDSNYNMYYGPLTELKKYLSSEDLTRLTQARGYKELYGKMVDKAKALAFENYRSLAGEVEARNVQERYGLAVQDLQARYQELGRWGTPTGIANRERVSMPSYGSKSPEGGESVDTGVGSFFKGAVPPWLTQDIQQGLIHSNKPMRMNPAGPKGETTYGKTYEDYQKLIADLENYLAEIQKSKQ